MLRMSSIVFKDVSQIPISRCSLSCSHEPREYLEVRQLVLTLPLHEPREYLEVRQLVLTLPLHAPREYLEVRQFVFTLPLHAPCEYLEVRHTSRNQNLTKAKSPVELRPRQGVSVKTLKP